MRREREITRNLGLRISLVPFCSRKIQTSFRNERGSQMPVASQLEGFVMFTNQARVGEREISVLHCTSEREVV